MLQENVGVVRRTHAEWERGNMTAGIEVFEERGRGGKSDVLRLDVP